MRWIGRVLGSLGCFAVQCAGGCEDSVLTSSFFCLCRLHYGSDRMWT